MHLKLSVSDFVFEMSNLIFQLENKLLPFFAIIASSHISALVGPHILKCSIGAFLDDYGISSGEKKTQPECSQVNCMFTITVKNLLDGYLIYKK